MLTAVPDLQAVASSHTGSQGCDVKYSVIKPTSRPPTVPLASQEKALAGVPVAEAIGLTVSRATSAGSTLAASQQGTGSATFQAQPRRPRARPRGRRTERCA